MTNKWASIVETHMFQNVVAILRQKNKKRRIMEAVLGIKGNQFTMLACDKTHISNIFRLNNHCDKFYDLGQHCSMAVGGHPSDSKQFGEYIAKNFKLYSIRNKYDLDVKAIPHFIRHTLAETLRSGNPFVVNTIVGGFSSENNRSFLYFIDPFGSIQEVPVASHGIGGLMSMGILGEHSKPDLSEKTAYGALEKCVSNIHSRFTVNLPNFQVKVIDKNGIRELPDITVASLFERDV